MTNLANKPLMKNIAMFLVGVIMIIIPGQGILGKWLGFGKALGAGIALIAIVDSFRMLFLNNGWIAEIKQLGSIAAFRIIWFFGLAGLVALVILY